MNIQDIFKISNSKEAEQEIREAERAIDMTGDIARKCLQYPDFDIYRRDFKRAEDSMINAMIAYTKHSVENGNVTIEKYGMVMMRIVTKLEAYRALLVKVENNAKKDIKKVED